MSWVFENSEATLGSRLVLLALADYAHDDGTMAFPSVQTLAAHTRMSERQVQRTLKRLAEEGHITAEGKSRAGTTVYSVTMGGDNLSQGGDISGADSARNVTRSVKDPPLTSSATAEDSSVSSLVAEIIEVWRQVMGLNGNAKPTPARRRKVADRLKEGYTPERIKAAIRKCAASEFHRSKGHIDLTLICRSGDKLEWFENLPAGGTEMTDHQREVAAALEQAPAMSEQERRKALESVGLAV